ncbi:MAG: extracellular solute-binding protein [Chloroflexi bacterium]|nr:extracellular solute-binding protein [Chloroflexota bacterium]
MRKLQMLFAVMMVAFGTAIFSAVPAAAQSECTAATPCEINIWIIFSDHRYDWAVDTGNRFMKEYPQFKINFIQQKNYDESIKNYVLAKEQGTVPTIIQTYEIGTQFSLDSGYFKFADDIIAGRSDVLGQPVNFDDILPVIANYYTLDGKWASVAWNTSTAIMYNNMDILNKVGVTEPPKTWGEFEEVCAKLQPLVDAKEIDGCASWALDDWYTEQWMAQQNELMVNNDNGRTSRATEVLVNGEGMVNIAKFYQDIYAKKFYVYTGLTKGDESGQLFGAGRTAIFLNSSAGARGVMAAAKEANVNVVTSPMIYNEEKGYTGNILGGATMWISNGLTPEVEDGAMAFLLFFSNTENSASWHTASGYVPVRLSSVELLQNLKPGNDILWNIQDKMREDIPGTNWYADNPAFLTASTQLNNSQITYATRGALLGTYVETRPIINQALEDLMINGGDPAEYLTNTKVQLDQMLQEYNDLNAP